MNKLLISIICVGVIVAGVLWYAHEPANGEVELGDYTAPVGMPVDMIGTQNASTTVGEYFDALTSASSTAIKKIGTYIDTVTFTIHAVSATSTADAYFAILGSNDQNCDTATTSTSYPNQSLKNEIRWFDIGQNLLNLTGTLTFASTGTTTLEWIDIVAGDGRQIVLTDVNTECIKFEMNAADLIAQVQMVTRSIGGY